MRLPVMQSKLRFLAGAVLALTLTACSVFEEEDVVEEILEGERISILQASATLKPDSTTEDEKVAIPAFSLNESWEQIGGGLVNNQGNFAIRSTEVEDTTTVGDGYDWESSLVAVPIVAEEFIYAMDGRGYISAHALKNIDEVVWVSDALVEKESDRDMTGGGFAYADGVVYATSGYGRIVALDVKNGAALWNLAQGIPMRAAPRVVNGWLLAVTVDNQTLAINANSGKIVWSHRGISESAGFLANVAPAVVGETVIVPYSSGELVALDIATGQQRWVDMLLSPRKTNALSRFSGIMALPVVHEGVVYTLHASGMLVAHLAENGAILWEREINAQRAPWIVGDYMVLLTRSDEMVLLRHRDGQIVWVQKLLREYDDERWLEPVVAGNHILSGSSEGVMRVHSPATGNVVTSYDIPDDVATPPVIAQGGMYFLTRDATLHALY